MTRRKADRVKREELHQNSVACNWTTSESGHGTGRWQSLSLKVDQAVRVDLSDEVLPAEITSIDWLPDGIYYDIDLGLAEFAEEETEVAGHENMSIKIYKVRRRGLVFLGAYDYTVDRGGVSVLGLNISCSGVPQYTVAEIRHPVPLRLARNSSANVPRMSTAQGAQNAKDQKMEDLFSSASSSRSHIPQGMTVPPPNPAFKEGEAVVVRDYRGYIGPDEIGDRYTYCGTYSFGRVVCPSFRAP